MKRSYLILLVAPTIALGGCGGELAASIPALANVGQATGLGVNASDEEQIAQVIEEVQQGMEARQIFKVLAHVSRNYHDSEGRDYAAIEAYLNYVFKKYRTIRVTRVVPRILVQGVQARAVETFGTVAEPQDLSSDPPINMQGQVTVSLEKAGGQWQIVEWGSLL